MENSLEFIAFNYQLAKKINIRDLVRNKINGQKPAEKFADIDSQVENTLQKLTSVILDNLGLRKFHKDLKEMNDETDYKVKYDTGMIFIQLLGFINQVIKNSQNGYLGYKFQVRQID